MMGPMELSFNEGDTVLEDRSLGITCSVLLMFLFLACIYDDLIFTKALLFIALTRFQVLLMCTKDNMYSDP